jgi:hypothetical protein
MLKQLAQQTLPINVESIAEVDKIRVHRNPATGEAMTIKASKVPKFTPGKACPYRFLIRFVCHGSLLKLEPSR